MEQPHKTNPINQELFVPLSSSPSPSFRDCCCGIISRLPLQRPETFFFGVCLCSKSFFCSVSAHAVKASQGVPFIFTKDELPEKLTINLR